MADAMRGLALILAAALWGVASASAVAVDCPQPGKCAAEDIGAPDVPEAPDAVATDTVEAIGKADEAEEADKADKDGDTDEADEADAPAAPPTLRDTIEQAKSALSEKLLGVQISGFGDIHSYYSDSGQKRMEHGAFELNASGDFSEKFQGAMALVFSKGNEPTVTTAFLDFHTMGGRIAPRGRLWVEKGYHVQIGRFDVPFGNDWQFFPSKDSVSISRPLTTDLIMDGGYNDAGMRVLGNNGSVNFNGYLLRGFNKGHLVGARVGLTPFTDPFSLAAAKDPKGFELGLSYLRDVTKQWVKNEDAWAVDMEIANGPWRGKFEYMMRRQSPTLELNDKLKGWHLTQELDLGDAVSWPTIAFLRFDKVRIRPAEIDSEDAAPGDDRDRRVTIGFKTNVGDSDVLQWKVEAQRYLSATPSTRETPGYGSGTLWLTQFVLVL